jgi:hypothetical protein
VQLANRFGNRSPKKLAQLRADRFCSITAWKHRSAPDVASAIFALLNLSDWSRT